MRNENRIQFSDHQQASVVNITRKTQLKGLTKALGLGSQEPVLVLVGGAAGVDDSQAHMIKKITDVIAWAAETAHAIIIDGGTQSGVMAAIGQSRYERRYQFPLVGVAVERLLIWPGDPREEKITPNKEKRAPFDPNHTHFVLVPGSTWGDESPWIAKLATVLSGDNPSLTILVNGGEISRLDVENSLATDRPVLVLKGSGRLADELVKDTHSTLIKAIAAEDGNALYQTISEILKGGNSWQSRTPMMR